MMARRRRQRSGSRSRQGRHSPTLARSGQFSSSYQPASARPPSPRRFTSRNGMSAPDTILMTSGLNQISAGNVLVTPAEGSQGRLADKLAGGGVILSTGPVALTNTQLSNLFTDPVLLIAAPGPGKAIMVTDAIATLIFGTSGYLVTDDGPNLWYGTDVAVGQAVGYNFAGVFSAVTNSIEIPLPTTIIASLSVLENQPVMLLSDGSNMTGGDGTGSITVYYTIVNL